ncbi:MAG TPA: outer membrane protein transport protein [Polyangia bacterium]|jgi:long-chain fatty acid transport protein|nr:outer membrane protein transport protein [Polyangia bacterium]
MTRTALRRIGRSSAVTIAVLAGLAGGRVCRASGFLIYDLSGEAIGRASAVTAGINEPAAVWFNPAALSFMKGESASVGGVFVTARSRFSPAGGGPDTDSDRGNFLLPTIFASGTINNRLAVGMGVYTAFGIGIRWPDDWAGRQNAIAASLQTLAFNPTLSVKLHRMFSLAVGFDAIRGSVDFTTGLPTLIGGDVRLAGGAWGYGFNVGALIRPLPERFQIAVTYRSRVAMHFNDGQADFSPAHPEFIPQLPDQSGSAAITLPDIITAGVMGRPIPTLTLSLDANLVLWTTYQKIDIKFVQAPMRTLEPDGRDTVTLRAGAEWETPLPGFMIRGGVIYDRSAVRGEGLGPGLPDATRLDLALGVGFGRGHLRADLGYLLVYFLPADAVGGRESPEGTYRSLAHLLGLTLAASWH